MSTSGRLTPLRTRRAGRAATALVAAAIGMGGLAACGESAGPEAGEVTIDDLQAIEEDIGELEERVGVLEEAPAAEPDAPVDPVVEDEAGLFDDPDPLIGQEVTVSAEVSELVATTDVGAAYWIAGESGEPIAVIMATPPAELDANDVVRVSGTVVQVAQDTFEQDFGIAADELFDDPDAFFAEAEGQVALAADRMEILQEQAD
ncbi:hypothetical protein E4P41_14195 [Geodermatophilus sp. DF01-2]|uniref:hypothetical protein n=1 Tax=Geodermatophilus sp. DF01-2 TaxID=2559610 RepID=UPI0010741DDA|nr:hypothetical protein [Geodermatophilus sp. DF01_2]TFV57734.1 hypothetical protein E4P41_14195 [Geodermatophilus sp. DF01_2]